MPLLSLPFPYMHGCHDIHLLSVVAVAGESSDEEQIERKSVENPAVAQQPASTSKGVGVCHASMQLLVWPAWSQFEEIDLRRMLFVIVLPPTHSLTHAALWSQVPSRSKGGSPTAGSAAAKPQAKKMERPSQRLPPKGKPQRRNMSMLPSSGKERKQYNAAGGGQVRSLLSLTHSLAGLLSKERVQLHGLRN